MKAWVKGLALSLLLGISVAEGVEEQKETPVAYRMRVVDYKIFCHYLKDGLEKEVKKELTQGYDLWGGLAIEPRLSKFCQTMVKYQWFYE